MFICIVKHISRIIAVNSGHKRRTYQKTDDLSQENMIDEIKPFHRISYLDWKLSNKVAQILSLVRADEYIKQLLEIRFQSEWF